MTEILRLLNSSSLINTLWQWAILVLVVALSTILIRFSFTIDVNKLLESRRARQIVRLQNACPHVGLQPMAKGKFTVTYFFTSPPGTILYICSKCQLRSFNPEQEFGDLGEYYAANPDKYLIKIKDFEKLLKKYGYV